MPLSGCQLPRRLLLEELRSKIRSEHEELAGGSSITCMPMRITAVQRQSDVHRLTVLLDTSAREDRWVAVMATKSWYEGSFLCMSRPCSGSILCTG